MSRMITVVKKPDNFLYKTFETAQKAGIDAVMSSYGFFTVGGSRGKSYRGRVSVNKEFIFLYTAQKFRRKTKMVPLTKKHKVKNGANDKKFKTELVRHAHWEVRVFKFPLSRIIEAKQESRTFKVTIEG